MIEDSNPWKWDLGRDTDKLKKRLLTFKRGSRYYPTESLLYAVERYCLITAFVVRRLLESEKLSEELERSTVVVHAFRRRTRGYRPLDFMTKGDIEKRYILRGGVQRRIALPTLANILIHSADLVQSIGANRNFHVFVSSAKHSREIVRFRLNDLISRATETAEDDIVNTNYQRDPKTGAFIATQRSRVLSPTAAE